MGQDTQHGAPPRARRWWTGRFTNAGFLAQWLYQEVLPPGLHREPWREAIGAYERADATEPGAPPVRRRIEA